MTGNWMAQGPKNISDDNELTFSLTTSGVAAISTLSLAVYILKGKYCTFWNGDIWSA
jgi:hypothetical protein